MIMIMKVIIRYKEDHKKDVDYHDIDYAVHGVDHGDV